MNDTFKRKDNDSTVIEFKDITLCFGEKQIFDRFNLQIAEGEKVVLAAASGSGKSSLVKMLLGFLVPESGEVFYRGSPLTKQTVEAVRRDVCYISQEIRFDQIPVRQFLTSLLRYRCNRHIKYDEARVLQLFRQLHMDAELLEKDTQQLSGGERERLAIVLCILLDRPVWVLDEITAGLDEVLKQKTIDLVINQKKTVLVISHDSVWKQNLFMREVKW